MSDDDLRIFREVQQHFRLPSVALVEKDQLVVRAIAAIAAIDADPFTLVFGGGTALARAHKLVRRMSEDVDFKIVLPTTTSISKSKLRKGLGTLRARVTTALQGAGFVFDAPHSGDENRYVVYQLGYNAKVEAAEILRPTIQIEFTYATLRLPSVALSVSSFVAEAHGAKPEANAIACVSLAETAAEKLVSLTRRTAMELAGLSRDPDPALVRHIYDLHAMRGHIDHDQVAALVREIVVSDGEEFRNQYPAYASDPTTETRKALDALGTIAGYRARYAEFLAAMVYGEQSPFDEAFATVLGLADRVWPL